MLIQTDTLIQVSFLFCVDQKKNLAAGFIRPKLHFLWLTLLEWNLDDLLVIPRNKSQEFMFLWQCKKAEGEREKKWWMVIYYVSRPAWIYVEQDQPKQW